MPASRPLEPNGELCVISMRCRQTKAREHCEFHSHPFDEFTLVTDDSTTNGYALGKVHSEPNTLFLFRRGEDHGFWNAAVQSPRFWVIHFEPGSALLRELSQLRCLDPGERVWHLPPGAVATFKWIFLRLFTEHAQAHPHGRLAEAALLQFLLINVQRWATGNATQNLSPEIPDPEVLRLWHLINDCVGRPADFTRSIADFAGYDSLRHRFKDIFGASPRQLLLQLRMQKAKNLLLDTPMSIAEIAETLGYERQHEFARAFRKHAGASPSEWRVHPFLKDDSFASESAKSFSS
jgi:hypothetical protein